MIRARWPDQRLFSITAISCVGSVVCSVYFPSGVNPLELINVGRLDQGFWGALGSHRRLLLIECV